MLGERRVLFVLLVALVVGIPAGVLGAMCFGNACGETRTTVSDVPFCSLPPETRSLLAAGFREDRSPHVMAVTGVTAVRGNSAVPGGPWPSEVVGDEGTVPLVFAGTGVDPGAEPAQGSTLDAVAPTIAEVIGLRRPHPGVRSGTAVPGLASSDRPRLVLEVVWKGSGARDLERAPERWPVLRRLMQLGAATLEAEVGSRPLDHAAVMTTIGTGGLPRDHGITGSVLRNEDGAVASAWVDEEAPLSVIAGLGDDLDELLDQEPRIGLVATDLADLGLIGGNWYVSHDRDDVLTSNRPDTQVRMVRRLLDDGYGADGTPDLLGVTLDAPIAEMDRALGGLIEAARMASGDSVLIVVTSTGSMDPDGTDPVTARAVQRDAERALGDGVVEAMAQGGLFLRQDELAARGISDDRVVMVLRDMRTHVDERMFADAFPGLAVTFARYC
ncbi:MAG: hypothetical protein M3135_07950 [Actinomycetota bacterium]|nr:hypothetical protein [Actinomycetota bacterium]